MYSRKHEPTASHLQAPGGRLGFSFPKWLLNIATHHTERHVGTGLPAPDQAWASLLRSISWLLGFSTGVQDDHIVCHYWGLCSERVAAVLMALLAQERRCMRLLSLHPSGKCCALWEWLTFRACWVCSTAQLPFGVLPCTPLVLSVGSERKIVPQCSDSGKLSPTRRQTGPHSLRWFLFAPTT